MNPYYQVIVPSSIKFLAAGEVQSELPLREANKNPPKYSPCYGNHEQTAADL
jgi:hypothetical protein